VSCCYGGRCAAVCRVAMVAVALPFVVLLWWPLCCHLSCCYGGRCAAVCRVVVVAIVLPFVVLPLLLL
ncbi:hypothetical protein A2U01_0103586, partial [Trifolium medium]|nr:hypothetical protein [Trifolium medium]